MSKDKKSTGDFLGDLISVEGGMEKSISILKDVFRFVGELLGKKEIPDTLRTLHNELFEELETIDWTIKDLRFRFFRYPNNKWLTGQQLTREEYYLLAAQGILRIPSVSGLREAYEEYSLYYLYEDDEAKGYINPCQEPTSPPVPQANGSMKIKCGAILGITPEDVKTSFLREDQKDYFREFEPDLFSRFKKE
ncbi:MAG: hypothetical protein ACLQBC_06155 [Syntrophales bacterium]